MGMRNLKRKAQKPQAKTFRRLKRKWKHDPSFMKQVYQELEWDSEYKSRQARNSRMKVGNHADYPYQF